MRKPQRILAGPVNLFAIAGLHGEQHLPWSDDRFLEVAGIEERVLRAGDEDEDAEMYDDEETGSEDTSATDEEAEEALEEDLEDETGDSEGGWHDEEEEEDLVENEENGVEGDDGEEEEAEEAEVMWQVC